MSSKTSFFNMAIAKKGIKRTMPVWLTHAVIWIFAAPILIGNLIQYADTTDEIGYYILMDMYVGGTLMAFGFCCIMTELLTNYLYSAKSTSFYHSLPVRRSTLFTTNIIVTLSTLLIPAALIGLSTMLILYVNGFHGSDAYILRWFWRYVQLVVFFTGFATLCSNITGHVGIGTVIYGILSFAAVALELAVKYIMQIFLYGMTVDISLITKPLSPVINLYLSGTITKIDESYFFRNTHYVLMLFIAGIGFMALGYLLYRSRHSESSGEIISAPSLRPLFKYCMSAGFAFILGTIFYYMSYDIRNRQQPSIIIFTICMLFGGGIGYFTAEMLLKKSFRVLKRSYKGFIAVAVAITAFGAAIGFDVFGVINRIPAGSSIENITISCSYTDFSASINGDDEFLSQALDLHRSIIGNRQHDTALHYESEESGYYYTYINISFNYTLKNGSALKRSYQLPVVKNDYQLNKREEVSGYLDALRDIFSQPEVVKRAYPGIWDNDKYNMTEVYIYAYDSEFSAYLKNDIFNSLLPLIRQGYENKILSSNLFESMTRDDYDTGLHMGISFINTENNKRQYYTITVPVEYAELYSFITNPSNLTDLEPGDIIDDVPAVETNPA